MGIVTEQKLIDFEFWGRGRDNAFLLTYEELDRVELILKDVFKEAPTEYQINDLFWFEFDKVCGWLGIKEINQRRIGA